MKTLALAVAALLAGAFISCAREDGLPDPEPQVLVPCDPRASDDDPLACPPGDPGLDAGIDAPIEAAADGSTDAL
jgi:hypothetical protein